VVLPKTYPVCQAQNGTTMSDMATDKTQIKFYAKREKLRDALKRAADADMRSVSTLIEMILTEWLEGRGYLKPEKRSK
jgi:hypothetical protein